MAGFSLSSLTDRIFGISRGDDATVVAAGRTSDNALLEMLDGLSNGETIVGKILSSSEDSFKIITNNNITLSAKAQGGVILKEGSNVLFEVCKSADRHVRLRPLYQNTADASTASLALRQAMIPVNDRSLELVARRMEYGESIDRNSLFESYKDVQSFEESPVKYIVDLQEMKLPVTLSNLEQYEAFMNMTNSISEALDGIAAGIGKELVYSYEQGTELFKNFALELRNAVEELPTLSDAPLSFNIADVMELTTTLKEAGITTNSLDNLCLSEVEAVTPERVLSSLLTDLSENATNISVEIPVTHSDLLSGNDGVIYEPSYKIEDNTITPDLSTENLAQYPTEKTSDSEPYISSDDFAKLLSSNCVSEIISRTMVSRGLVNKDKLGDKAEIGKMYNRMLAETDQLLNAIGSKINQNSEVALAIQNLQNNIDFVNALNTFVPYMQIPFHSEGGKHNGELYVFKNKHSLSSSDSEITAFLHLNMENLGPTDVFVSLKNANVTTNFTLRDEETLNFIEKNIHFLDRRLTEKGYGFKFEAKTEKQMKSPIETMLSNKLNKIVVAKTSFDARA